MSYFKYIYIYIYIYEGLDFQILDDLMYFNQIFFNFKYLLKFGQYQNVGKYLSCEILICEVQP